MKTMILVVILVLIIFGSCASVPVVTHKELTYSYTQDGESVTKTESFIRYEFQLITGKFIGITIDGSIRLITSDA